MAATQTRRPPADKPKSPAQVYLTCGALARIFEVAPRTMAKWCDKMGLAHRRREDDRRRSREIRLVDAIAWAAEHGIDAPGLCRVLWCGPESSIADALADLVDPIPVCRVTGPVAFGEALATLTIFAAVFLPGLPDWTPAAVGEAVVAVRARRYRRPPVLVVPARQDGSVEPGLAPFGVEAVPWPGSVESVAEALKLAPADLSMFHNLNTCRRRPRVRNTAK